MDMSEYTGRAEPKDAYARLLKHNAVFCKHRRTMLGIYDFIDKGLYDAAHESWEEIPHEDQMDLHLPKSKGGFFWPHEQQIVVRGVDKTTNWICRDYSVPHSAEDKL